MYKFIQLHMFIENLLMSLGKGAEDMWVNNNIQKKAICLSSQSLDY